MPTDCNPKLFAFKAVERKKVVRISVTPYQMAN
jgi:hypothetical protein